MPVATIHASAALGIDAPVITVEAEISAGLPQTRIVGLPETAVRESRDRVKAALTSSGFSYPQRRITINLAPADMPKQGGRYDLAIAVAILAASSQLGGAATSGIEFLGELSLTGRLRAVRGVLPAMLRDTPGRKLLIVPVANAAEVAITGRDDVVAADSLRAVILHLTGQQRLPGIRQTSSPEETKRALSLSDVKGQVAAKRALTIAAAGHHNLLMIGPPGTGKTMLATRLSALLPPLALEEALEVASIASVARRTTDTDCFRNWMTRPFRAPHHTASAAAIVGGGNPPGPGEISLAHHGILFLDELPEFSRHVLEVLREPLESGEVLISRAAAQVRYPARFQLVAAMNPCPCGLAGDQASSCECTADQVQRYRAKVSGPLLDRIDLHIEVPPLPRGALSAAPAEETNEGIKGEEPARSHVLASRDRMLERQGKSNSLLNPAETARYCRLREDDRDFLDDSVTRLGISARGFYKVLKVSRTIADLSGDDEVQRVHLIEALGYRKLDRKR